MHRNNGTHVGAIQHYRRMKTSNARQSLGIALSAERNLAALSIIHNGFASSGNSIALNPLSSQRIGLSTKPDLIEKTTNVLTETVFGLQEIDPQEMTKTEIALLSDIEEQASAQAYTNYAFYNQTRRRNIRSPIVAYHEKKVIPDTRAPAPLMPVVVNPPAERFEVDLIFLGFVMILKIDIKALEKELRKHSGGRKAIKELSSPAARSNHAPAIEALGYDFPPAIFSLRGNELTITKMVLENLMDDSRFPEVWNWRQINQADHKGPVLEADSMMAGIDLYRCERRSLAAVLKDDRIHPSIRIAKASRDATKETTKIYIQQKTVPLMPIGEITEERLIPPSRILPNQIWMEPDGFTRHDACKMLLDAITGQSFHYEAEVYEGQILLRIDINETIKGSGRYVRSGLYGKTYTYPFVQTDFKNKETLLKVINQAFAEHKVAVDATMSKEQIRRAQEKIKQQERDQIEAEKRKAREQREMAAQAKQEDQRRKDFLKRDKEYHQYRAQNYHAKGYADSEDQYEIHAERLKRITKHVHITSNEQQIHTLSLISQYDNAYPSFTSEDKADQKSLLTYAVSPRRSDIMNALIPFLNNAESGQAVVRAEPRGIAYLESASFKGIEYKHTGWINQGSTPTQKRKRNNRKSIGILTIAWSNFPRPYSFAECADLRGKRLSEVIEGLQYDDIIIREASLQSGLELEVISGSTVLPIQWRNDYPYQWDSLIKAFPHIKEKQA